VTGAIENLRQAGVRVINSSDIGVTNGQNGRDLLTLHPKFAWA